MPRLPIAGADNDFCCAILNEYLQFEHKADGTHNFGIFNVLTFGAKCDGITDDTRSIQAALNAAEPVGGVVWLPPGSNAYRCNGSLTIPGHVTLKGGYGGMRRGLRLWKDTPRGSVLHVYNKDRDANFISLSHNSILDGIEIYYPDQRTEGKPYPYGWTIVMLPNQHGATIRNICSPNPYKFIYANADGFLIDGVQGYPLEMGIQLNRVADVPRINNIHFNGNCWSDAEQSLRDWVQTNGICMKVFGVEELMINNLFAYGYLRGIWFGAYTQDSNFPGNYGSLNVFGFDAVQEGILIETGGISDRQGFSLSNGRIIPFKGSVGARAGIKFHDPVPSPGPGGDTVPSPGPGVSVSNVSFFGEHERSIWIEPKFGAKISMLGGQSTGYTNEMVLCESPTASVRLIGVRSFKGNGPRIHNPGGGDISDFAPITA